MKKKNEGQKLQPVCSVCGKAVINGVIKKGKLYHPECLKTELQKMVDVFVWNPEKTSRTDYPICPYCGYVEENERIFIDDERPHKHTCPQCEHEFEYSTINTVIYNTNRKDEMELD